MRVINSAILALLVFLLGCPVAQAGELTPVRYNGSTALLTNAALNGSQASLTTQAIDTRGVAWLRLTVQFTAGGTASGYDLNCEESDTDTSNWRQITPYDVAGVMQPTQPLYVWPNDADRTQSYVIRVVGFSYTRCYFVARGTPTASDVINSVTAYTWQ